MSSSTTFISRDRSQLPQDLDQLSQQQQQVQQQQQQRQQLQKQQHHHHQSQQLQQQQQPPYKPATAMPIPGSITRVLPPPPLPPSRNSLTEGPSPAPPSIEERTIHYHPTRLANSQVRAMSFSHRPPSSSALSSPSLRSSGMYVSLADSLATDEPPSHFNNNHTPAPSAAPPPRSSDDDDAEPTVFPTHDLGLPDAHDSHRDEGYSSLSSIRSHPLISRDRFISHSRYNFKSYGDEITEKLKTAWSFSKQSPRSPPARIAAHAPLTAPLPAIPFSASICGPPSAPLTPPITADHSVSSPNPTASQTSQSPRPLGQRKLPGLSIPMMLTSRSKRVLNDTEPITQTPTSISPRISSLSSLHNGANIDAPVMPATATSTVGASSRTYPFTNTPNTNNYNSPPPPQLERRATAPVTQSSFDSDPHIRLRSSTNMFLEDVTNDNDDEMDDYHNYPSQKRRNPSPARGVPKSKSQRRSDEESFGPPSQRLAGPYQPSTFYPSTSGRTGMFSHGLNLTTNAALPHYQQHQQQDALSPVKQENAAGRFSPPKPREPPLSSPPLSPPPPMLSMPRSKVGQHSLLICECCPKKPRKFETPEELSAHRAEKQFGCGFCNNRFKNKNEAERHQNSLHVRPNSWSCSALSTFDRAFYESVSRPGEADMCGYCGDDFLRTGRPDHSSSTLHATEQDWEERVRHLQEVHKFRECNASKKFYRADHFRQHLKHSHGGTSGKWTSLLETACMMEEDKDKDAGR